MLRRLPGAAALTACCGLTALCPPTAALPSLDEGEEPFIGSNAPNSDRDQMRFIDGPEHFQRGCSEGDAAIIAMVSFQRMQELHLNNFIIGSHIGRLPLGEMISRQPAYPVLPISTTAQKMEDVSGIPVKAPLVEPDRDLGVLAPSPISILWIRGRPRTRLGLVEVIDNMARCPFRGQILPLLKIFTSTGVRFCAEPWHERFVRRRVGVA